MRVSDPLIVILPALPAPIGDVTGKPAARRRPFREIGTTLALLALGAVLGLGLVLVLR